MEASAGTYAAKCPLRGIARPVSEETISSPAIRRAGWFLSGSKMWLCVGACRCLHVATTTGAAITLARGPAEGRLTIMNTVSLAQKIS